MTPYRQRKESGMYDPNQPDAEPPTIEIGDTIEHGNEEAEDAGNGLTVLELRDELKAKGLPTSGNKAELEERLAAATLEGDA